MIYINKVRTLSADETFVLMDFDRTLTTAESSVTWGLLEESPFVDEGYAKDSVSLYHKYRPIEVDPTLDFQTKSYQMEEWFQQTIGLLRKYHIYGDTVLKILNSSHGLRLRKDSKTFLEKMHLLNIPVIIVSAGLGDFISRYLSQEGCLYDNITIYSNFLIYERNRIIGVKQPLIHSLNKGMLTYPEIETKKQGLLFGDQIEDIQMGEGLDTVSIGFCDSPTHLEHFRKHFDVVLTGESSYQQVGKIYIKDYKNV